MKIAITGTHSSGKTTLARKISEEYCIPYVRGDKAKKICDLFFYKPINELSLQEQWRLQNLMFRSCDEIFRTSESAVTDGFHLTCIPYGIEYTNGKIAQIPGYDSFIERVMEQSRKFDKILYLPPEVELDDNKFRPLDEELRIRIDEQIYSLLQGFDFRTVCGTPESRIRISGDEIGVKNKLWNNYVVFEGLPRAGKTTYIRLLKERANHEGRKLHVTQKDNECMAEFRQRRKSNPYDNSTEVVRLYSEAIRQEFESSNVEERLHDGQIVVSDRQKFTLLTLFGALGVSRHRLYELVYGLPEPGRTIYLDVSPEVSVKRSSRTEPGSIPN